MLRVILSSFKHVEAKKPFLFFDFVSCFFSNNSLRENVFSTVFHLSNDTFDTRDCSLCIFSIAKIIFFAKFHKIIFCEGDAFLLT